MRIAAMKMMTSAAAAFVLLASPLCASPAAAASARDVRDGWVSATVPGQSVAAAYMTVRSAPGVVHLMLTGVKRPLKPGDIVQLEFTTVDGAGAKASTRVDLPVRKESPR